MTIYDNSLICKPNTLAGGRKTPGKVVGRVAFLTVYLQESWVFRT
jgi:hypothetical protein